MVRDRIDYLAGVLLGLSDRSAVGGVSGVGLWELRAFLVLPKVFPWPYICFC